MRWFHCVSGVGQNIMVEGHGGANLLTSWQAGSKEQEKNMREALEARYIPQGHTP